MPVSRIPSTPNHFHGEVIDADKLTTNPEEFEAQFPESAQVWGANGTRVVWLELDTAHAPLVPVAARLGFVYHHAEPGNLTMALRIQESAYVPPYATHYIGVGGVVLRDPETLLVVSERFRSGRPRYYKLPGGAILQGEHLEHAIVREVREETGIEARFVSLACFRHWHGYRYGKSDIYFVCRLDALTFDIQRQTEEIEECFWMPIAEYVNHPEVSAFNRRIIKAVFEAPGLAPDPIEGYGTPETHELFMPRRAAAGPGGSAPRKT